MATRAGTMTEHLAPIFYFAQVHLLSASLVFGAGWALAALPLGNPGVKYWIWVTASLNFMLPVGGLIDGFGALDFAGAEPLIFVNDLSIRLARASTACSLLLVIWAIGAVVMFARFAMRAWAEHRRGAPVRSCVHQTYPLRKAQMSGVPVSLVQGESSPAVVGLLRPHIVLPSGIDRLLTDRELTAVLIHEVTHAERRDNLIRLFHELAVCVLWFHPFLWVATRRLSLYRELSCDDQVIRKGYGRDLVGAFGKLTDPEREPLLRSSGSSFIGQRLARLTESRSAPPAGWTSRLPGALFAAALIGGVAITVLHTACCMVIGKSAAL